MRRGSADPLVSHAQIELFAKDKRIVIPVANQVYSRCDSSASTEQHIKQLGHVDVASS